MRYGLKTKPSHQKAYDASAGDMCRRASHGLIIKASDDPDVPEGRITGYGSKFGLVDSYNEIVMPGAFKKSLARLTKAKAILPILWQHDADIPIGGWDEYKEDETGLYLGGQLDLDTQAGREAWSAVKKRYVGGLSIGYYEVKADPWQWDNKEPRNLYELDLRETSVVTFPALKEARLDAVKAMRSMGQAMPQKDFTDFLMKELGLHEEQARTISEKGYGAFLAGESVAPSQSLDLQGILTPLNIPSLA